MGLRSDRGWELSLGRSPGPRGGKGAAREPSLGGAQEGVGEVCAGPDR